MKDAGRGDGTLTRPLPLCCLYPVVFSWVRDQATAAWESRAAPPSDRQTASLCVGCRVRAGVMEERRRTCRCVAKPYACRAEQSRASERIYACVCVVPCVCLRLRVCPCTNQRPGKAFPPFYDMERNPTVQYH